MLSICCGLIAPIRLTRPAPAPPVVPALRLVVTPPLLRLSMPTLKSSSRISELVPSTRPSLPVASLPLVPRLHRLLLVLQLHLLQAQLSTGHSAVVKVTAARLPVSPHTPAKFRTSGTPSAYSVRVPTRWHILLHHFVNVNNCFHRATVSSRTLSSLVINMMQALLRHGRVTIPLDKHLFLSRNFASNLVNSS
jgi:hypothetical protein